jgi:hypothetical protein
MFVHKERGTMRGLCCAAGAILLNVFLAFSAAGLAQPETAVSVRRQSRFADICTRGPPPTIQLKDVCRTCILSAVFSAAYRLERAFAGRY